MGFVRISGGYVDLFARRYSAWKARDVFGTRQIER